MEYVTLDNADALDAFVAAHSRSHIMQTSTWGRVKSDWLWHGLICRDEQGRIRGTLALLEHSCRIPGICLLYGPRGPIFDDLPTFRRLTEAAQRLGRARGAWLLRLDPEVPAEDRSFSDFVGRLGFTVNAADDFSLFQPRLCYEKDLSSLSEQTIPISWHRSARANLRKAIGGPLQVRTGSEKDLPVFHALMKQTADRCGFQARPLSYFEALLSGLGNNGTLYLAVCEDRVTAGAIAAWLPRAGWFLYSCSNEEGRSLHANELLQWIMQREAVARGCTRWDLRGVEGLPDETNPHLGLHRYKQGLGAELQIWVGQLDLVLRPHIAGIYRLLGRTGTSKKTLRTAEVGSGNGI